MAETTAIEWTATKLTDGTSVPGSTFNMWRGCTKVSQGCAHCYAETLSGRNPGTLGVWGPKGRRIVASEAYWRHPVRWNREAEASGVRRKVFCASLADVFEGRDTMPEQDWEAVETARARLWALIAATPHLDWLLLTKRPENVKHMVPQSWMFTGFPTNVWLGTSVEDQAAADERIPHLLQVPASVRFLSCEPLLGPVHLAEYWRDTPTPHNRDGTFGQSSTWDTWLDGIGWVIVGGESGPGARPMHPDWARSLRDQAVAAGVPFFFKQWGSWSPMETGGSAYTQALYTTATGKVHDWGDGWISISGDKHANGKGLDGRVWDEMPAGEGSVQ